MVKYIPSVTVPSDDFVVEDGEGDKYQPHEGEWVKFRTDLPFAVFKLIWGALPDDLDELEPLDRVQFNIGRGEEAIKALTRQIVDWSWTDDFGQPLPRPEDDAEAFAEALRWLSPDESNYLQSKVVKPGEASKNS